MKTEITKTKCGSDASMGEAATEAASVHAKLNNEDISKAKFTIPEMIDHLHNFMDSESIETVNKGSSFQTILENHKIKFIREDEWFIIPLCNDKMLFVDPKTGRHKYAWNGSNYSLKKLTPSGWTDFLCRHNVLPLDLASPDELEKITQADNWLDSIHNHLESLSLKHNVDKVSRHIFLTCCRGGKIIINCMKQFIINNEGCCFDFDTYDYKEIIELLMEDE